MKTTVIASAFLLSLCFGCTKTEEEAGQKANDEGIIKEIEDKTNDETSKITHFFKKKVTRKSIRESEVARETRESIKRLFPNAEVVEWQSSPQVIVESNNDSSEVFEVITPEVYIVTLKKDREVTQAKFTKDGQFIESRKPLSDEQFPTSITETLKQGLYKDWNIVSEKEEIKNVAEKENLYRIVVQKGKEKHVLYFTKDGKVAKILTLV